MTSEGNYPADPYSGPHGYPPEGDDYGQPYQQHEAQRAYAAADRPRDGERPNPGEFGQAAPAQARAAISVPGLRAEPPSDEPAAMSPGQGGQVYGRPAPTTYGRPMQPQMDERGDDPAPSAYSTPEQAPQAYGQPREPGVYGQPARSALDPEDVDAGYADDGYAGPAGYPGPAGYAGDPDRGGPVGTTGPAAQGGRAAVPGGRPSEPWVNDAPPAEWTDRGPNPQERHAPWAEDRHAPQADEPSAPWGNEPPAPWGDEAPRPQRLPGVYGQAAPAPQPLYGGAPSELGPRDDEASRDAAGFDRRDDRDLPSRNAPGFGPRDVSGFGAYDDRRDGPGMNRDDFHRPRFDRPDSEQSDFTQPRSDFAGPEFNGNGREFVEPRDSDADGPYGPTGPTDYDAPNGLGHAGFAAPSPAAPSPAAPSPAAPSPAAPSSAAPPPAAPPPAAPRGFVSPPGAGRAQVPGTQPGMQPGMPSPSQFGGQPDDPAERASHDQPGSASELGQNGFGDGSDLPGRPFHPGDPYPGVPGSPAQPGRVNGVAPRSGGVVYGSPRVYGEPRREPADAGDDTFGPPPSASGRAPIDDAPPHRPAHPGADTAGPAQFGRGTPQHFEPIDPEQGADRPFGGSPMPPGAAQSGPGSHPATTAFPASPPFGGGQGRGFSSVPGPNGAGPASPVSPGQSYQPIRTGQRPAGTVFGGNARSQADGGFANGVPGAGDGDRFDQRFDDGGDLRFPTSQPTGLLDEAQGPRRLNGRTIGIVAIIVVVIALLAGALYYTSRPNAPTYKIGACVQHSGDKVVGASCSMAGAFKIVSKVTDPGACPDTKNPYVSVDKTIYCLAPVQ